MLDRCQKNKTCKGVTSMKNTAKSLICAILLILIISTVVVFSGCNADSDEINATKQALGGGTTESVNKNTIISGSVDIQEDYKHYPGYLIDKVLLKDGATSVIYGADIKEITLCLPYYNLVVIFMKDKKATIMTSLDNIQIYFNCEITR